MTAEIDRHLTVVIIAYRKNRMNHRLVFGAPKALIRRDWRRELALFSPGDIFAYERWRANEYGTQDWRLFICAARAGGAVTRIPGVMPGADILLSARGKTSVKRALAAIDEITAGAHCPLETPPHFWRRLHNDLSASHGRRKQS